MDISHFVVEGADMDHSVDICASYSVMVHVKEGRKVNGEVQFRLTGEGLLDLPAFLRVLRRNGLEYLPVYAEVSVQQSRQPSYGPWETARFCYQALDRARQAVAAQ
jgi:sugar phosphate isomerase/epimerase